MSTEKKASLASMELTHRTSPIGVKDKSKEGAVLGTTITPLYRIKISFIQEHFRGEKEGIYLSFLLMCPRSTHKEPMRVGATSPSSEFYLKFQGALVLIPSEQLSV